MQSLTAYIDIQGKDEHLIKLLFAELKEDLKLQGEVEFPNSGGVCNINQVDFIGSSIYVSCSAGGIEFMKGISKAFYNMKFSIEALIENTRAVFANCTNGTVAVTSSYMV